MKNRHRHTSPTVTSQSLKFALFLVLMTLLAGVLGGCGSSGSSTAASTPATPTTSTDPATLATMPPEKVTVTMTDDTSATIEWTAVAEALSYNLYRGLAPGVTKGATTAVKISGVTSPYSDQNLEYNTTYYYVVTAISALGESRESQEVTATTGQAPINKSLLDSAASFLAAATGKEDVINVDQVVFVNTVLWAGQSVETASDDQLQSQLYSDLYVLLRDDYGVPILDDNGCEMPLASEPITIPVLDEQGNPVLDGAGNPVMTISTTVPMVVEEYMNGQTKCSVVETYSAYTIAVEIGRLNMVRSALNNPDTINRAFEDAINNINGAASVAADLAGRLVLVSSQEVVNDLGNVTTETVRTTIDSPWGNLAMYRNLLRYGKLVGYGVAKIGEEGQAIPAPWLEIRPDLPMGDLAYLRDGTPGRDYGVDLLPGGGFLNLSATSHAARQDYQGKIVPYVQYDPDDPAGCPYQDESADAWLRVIGGVDEPVLNNMAAFTKHADDARKMVVFLHNIIQDVPDDGIEPELPAATLVWNSDHTSQIPEMTGSDPQPRRHLLMEQAATFLAAAAGKETPLTVDSTVFVNTVLGINELELTDINKGTLYGDLWVLRRDENGVPAKDDNNCVMPLPSEPITMTVLDEFGNPQEVPLQTVPMMLEEYMDGQYKCAVVPGYEDFVIEVELGRLNYVRSFLTSPAVIHHQLHEVVASINSAVSLKRDLAGRLVYTTKVLDAAGLPLVDEYGVPVLQDNTIDSPLQNIALYWALLTWGKIDGTVTIKLEGEDTQVELAIADTVDVSTHGMEFLKYGDETGQKIGVLPDSNYADFSGFNHLSKFDFDGVLFDFVERVPTGTCAYQDVSGANIWTRILGGYASLTSNIAGFVAQAEDARKIIVFTHNIINDPLPVD